ncbi:MAG: ion transporter [Bacteroidia bacterium]
MLMIKRLFLNDKFILYLIFINVVLLFASGFNMSQQNNHALELIEHCFTLLFVIELAIKWYEHGFKNYFKINWNKFDFILVAISIPSVISFFLQNSGGDFSFL